MRRTTATIKRKARAIETLNESRIVQLNEKLDDPKVSEETKKKIRRVLRAVQKANADENNGKAKEA